MGTKMARMTYPSISAIVDEALAEVREEETRTKQAEAKATTTETPPRSELAQELHKLAAHCRTHSDNVTYADLEEFLNAR